jgi:HD-GYP domain-containing protein (c-di-GMP phosphodiesterase class II)
MVRFSEIKGIRGRGFNRQSTLLPKGVEDRAWLSDSPIRDEGEPSEAVLSAQSDPEVVSYHEKFVRTAMDVREKVTIGQGISASPILVDLHYVVEHHLEDKLYSRAMSASDDYDDVPIHSVEVTFASLLVGKGLGYDTKRLLQVGLAAFLENVGMYTLPSALFQKQSKLDDSEVDRIKQHPEMSRQLLSRLGEKYRWLAEVAVQVHERADGTGYPKGLRGGEISELASIIGLVDTYVAMISKRPYRDTMLQSDAVKFILREAKSQFPSHVLKAFLNEISLFPLNTYVRLNNHSVGRVIAAEKNQPLRPIVELAYDGLGNRLEKKEIVRLSDNPLLYILETLDDREFV